MKDTPAEPYDLRDLRDLGVAEQQMKSCWTEAYSDVDGGYDEGRYVRAPSLARGHALARTTCETSLSIARNGFARYRAIDAVRALRLLKDDLYDFPSATLSTRRNRLEHYEKVRVSEATVSRAIKRLGWVREKDRWVQRR